MKTSGTILFVSNDASRTGAPIFLFRFLRWLHSNSDYSFRILVGSEGDLVPEFEKLGAVDSFEPKRTIVYKVLRRLNLNRSYRAKHHQGLRAKLSACDIRLVYCNSVVNGKILDFLSFLNCPVICHVHELESVFRHFGPENTALIKQYTSQYIAVSQSVKSNLSAGHDIPAEKIRLIHGFIPDSEIQLPKGITARQSVRQELGIPLQSRLICAAGSMEFRKGIDLFLQVADYVKRAGADVHFVWVGGRSDLVQAIQKEVRSSGLQDIVHLIGPMPDVIPYYDAADVFLLTSREDPFPLVMLEAASRELPIVCFANSGGAPEFVENDAGLVVPNFDTARMAQEVMHLLSAPELSREIGRTGRQKVLNRHRLSLGAPKIAQVIQEQMGAPERRVAAQDVPGDLPLPLRPASC